MLKLKDFETVAKEAEFNGTVVGGQDEDGIETSYTKLEYSDGILTPLECVEYGDWYSTC